jgi:hypothetical protein
MAAGPPSREEQQQEAEEEEEERLKRGAEAVDAAEDKMGDYWTPPNGFPKHGFLTGTQPKDVIVKAQEGIAQQTAWDKVKSLFWWLQVGALLASLAALQSVSAPSDSCMH